MEEHIFELLIVEVQTQLQKLLKELRVAVENLVAVQILKKGLQHLKLIKYQYDLFLEGLADIFQAEQSDQQRQVLRAPLLEKNLTESVVVHQSERAADIVQVLFLQTLEAAKISTLLQLLKNP